MLGMYLSMTVGAQIPFLHQFYCTVYRVRLVYPYNHTHLLHMTLPVAIIDYYVM